MLTRYNSSVGLVPALAASFALTILVSFLSFRFFESPILGLKRHFSYDLSTTASGSQPK
jgi:peptidoglycan/LPS O-acetylase OafA/YrhL